MRASYCSSTGYVPSSPPLTVWMANCSGQCVTPSAIQGSTLINTLAETISAVSEPMILLFLGAAMIGLSVGFGSRTRTKTPVQQSAAAGGADSLRGETVAA